MQRRSLNNKILDFLFSDDTRVPTTCSVARNHGNTMFVTDSLSSFLHSRLDFLNTSLTFPSHWVLRLLCYWKCEFIVMQIKLQCWWSFVLLKFLFHYFKSFAVFLTEIWCSLFRRLWAEYRPAFPEIFNRLYRLLHLCREHQLLMSLQPSILWGGKLIMRKWSLHLSRSLLQSW